MGRLRARPGWTTPPQAIVANPAAPGSGRSWTGRWSRRPGPARRRIRPPGPAGPDARSSARLLAGQPHEIGDEPRGVDRAEAGHQVIARPGGEAPDGRAAVGE